MMAEEKKWINIIEIIAIGHYLAHSFTNETLNGYCTKKYNEFGQHFFIERKKLFLAAVVHDYWFRFFVECNVILNNTVYKCII